MNAKTTNTATADKRVKKSKIVIEYNDDEDTNITNTKSSGPAKKKTKETKRGPNTYRGIKHANDNLGGYMEYISGAYYDYLYKVEIIEEPENLAKFNQTDLPKIRKLLDTENRFLAKKMDTLSKKYQAFLDRHLPEEEKFDSKKYEGCWNFGIYDTPPTTIEEVKFGIDFYKKRIASYQAHFTKELNLVEKQNLN
jgi:hypothetical protein